MDVRKNNKFVHNLFTMFFEAKDVLLYDVEVFFFGKGFKCKIHDCVTFHCCGVFYDCN
jgi:hypothetical protein